MTYKTSLGNSAKVVTIGITLLFASIIFGQYSIIKDVGRVVPIFTTIALLSIYFIAFAFRPICYTLTRDKLIINRTVLNVKFERSNIKSVELIDKEKMSWSIRIFGIGGLFGYYGHFANAKFGSMTWYATRRDGMVLVETIDKRKIILTPDNPDKFVADFYL